MFGFLSYVTRDKVVSLHPAPEGFRHVYRFEGLVARDGSRYDEALSVGAEVLFEAVFRRLFPVQLCHFVDVAFSVREHPCGWSLWCFDVGGHAVNQGDMLTAVLIELTRLSLNPTRAPAQGGCMRRSFCRQRQSPAGNAGR